jgi:L-seryl-tRNA(Ser) seleniumtransferase
MSQARKNELLRELPQVEEVLKHPDIVALKEQLPHTLVADFVREAIQEARESILRLRTLPDDNSALVAQLSCEAIALKTQQKAQALQAPSLRKVINVSGIVLHTNLGRSVFSEGVAKAVLEAATNYTNLEFNATTQTRGSRHDHYERLLCALTGAEAALAVNNNAAAVMMVLQHFASGYEAIVSRGELVEIGGSFRVPDIMRLSHAEMIEVGTTNRTRLSDYEGAITPQTALLLKVHPSNYRMVGFTETVTIASLRELADTVNEQRLAATRDASAQVPPLLVYEDQGSGALFTLDCFGDDAEQSVAESLKRGSDLVSFSGDKLLGGPQAGIIVGSRKHIDALKKNPLARALRLDKMAIAALEATLRLYLDKDRALREIPTLRMLSMPLDEVRQRALQLQQSIEAVLPKDLVELSVVEESALAGGGALPTNNLASYALCIRFKQGDAMSCATYLSAHHPIPIIARIKKETLLCDGRTLLSSEEYEELARGLKGYFENLATRAQKG